jgi:biotin synthase-like enzyme
MKALLFQPPIYDTQYFPDWSQPSGLLKVGTWLHEELKYDLRLIDCLFPSKDGKVKHEIRKVVQVCSTIEWLLSDYRALREELYGSRAVPLDEAHRYKFEFGLSLQKVRSHLLKSRQTQLFEDHHAWEPDEVWITSIMTYWWESTVDSVLLFKEVYPKARIRIGGLYPTLAPHHLRLKLEALGLPFEIIRGRDLNIRKHNGETQVTNSDCIVTGEIPGASNAALYFDGYAQMTRDLEGQERMPNYAILTTSRGCPFDCSYCAQKAYNEGSLKIRVRDYHDTFNEIRDKYHTYGIHHFGFYEDNFLIEKPNIERLLKLLLDHKDELPHLTLYAPEGVEVRLIHQDLEFVKLMRDTGFDSVYLPLENMSRDVTRAWNRRHSHAHLFENAVKICHEANFELHNMEVNAFILFGMPDEDLQDIVNTIFYAAELVGGIVPMLFTPVPGSIMFEQHEEYLFDAMGFDLHHLNGKLYPFLKYNFERKGIRLEDYVALESLAFRLNAKALRQTFQFSSENRVYEALRNILALHNRAGEPLQEFKTGVA